MIHGNTTDQQLTGMVTVYAQLLVKSREQKHSNFKTTLIYNENLLTCTGFANAHLQIEDSLEVMLFPVEGKVELYWHDASVSLPDNTIIADLVFQSLDPGQSFISWDGSAGASLLKILQD